MAGRRVDAQPDPRMTQTQLEAQQNLIRAGIDRSRRNTHIELLIASGLLVGVLVIGYLGLAGEQTGTSANVDSQNNARPSITAPAPAEAIEMLEATQAQILPTYIALPPTATFALTETAAPTATPEPEETLWDMNRPLPPLDSQNAEFESNPQGGGAIRFTIEGRQYAIEIPRPEAVIDGAGSPIAEEGEITVKFFPPSSDARMGKSIPPRVAFAGESGEEMAWYNIAAAEWINRYQTLFGRDSWPAFPEISWIEGSLGFENYEKGSVGPEYIGDFYLTVSGRVKRVYTEQAWYPAQQRFVELTWASLTYDQAGEKTLETILFTDTEYPDDASPGGGQGVQIVAKPDDYTDFIPRSLSYRNEQILQAVKSSAFVQMRLGITYDSHRDGADFFASDPKWLLEYGYNSIIRGAVLEARYWDEQRGLARTIIAEKAGRPELKEQAGKLQDYPAADSGVRIGFGQLWIFVPGAGN